MDVRKKLVQLIVWIEDQMTRAYPYTTDQFRIETTVDHLIANGVTVQEWIPVTERLPEKGEDVLVFNTRENWTGFAWLRPDETWTALGFDFPFDLGEVTHWMPLPQPPKGE